MEIDNPEVETRLKQVLDKLTTGCNKYVSNCKGSASGPGIGKTKLDKERMKLCQREIVRNGPPSRFYICMENGCVKYINVFLSALLFWRTGRWCQVQRINPFKQELKKYIYNDANRVKWSSGDERIYHITNTQHLDRS